MVSSAFHSTKAVVSQVGDLQMGLRHIYKQWRAVEITICVQLCHQLLVVTPSLNVLWLLDYAVLYVYINIHVFAIKYV